MGLRCGIVKNRRGRDLTDRVLVRQAPIASEDIEKLGSCKTSPNLNTRGMFRNFRLRRS